MGRAQSSCQAGTLASVALALLALMGTAIAGSPTFLRGAHQNGSLLARRQLAAKRGDGFWSVQGPNFVDAAGNIVKFSGVIWSGFETPNAVLGGLDTRTMDSHLDQMVSLGLNMIRLPFAGDNVNPGTTPKPGVTYANPDLAGMNSLQVMDVLVAKCGDRGIKIILDYHRLHLAWGNELGSWFDDNTPEGVWINNWQSMAGRYKGNPTIVGADLFNEIHSAETFPAGAPFWNYTMADPALERYNYRSATIRVINAIKAIEPNWIITLEGINDNWEVTQGGYWWGGNVQHVYSRALTTAEVGNAKLAYSAHDYGPYVAPLPWFYDPAFPNNIVPLMRDHWGFMLEQGIAPLWVGEFGSWYPAPTNDFDFKERMTFQLQCQYIGKIGASWTLAFWGPGSKDTAGLLTDDWKTPNWDKYSQLKPILHWNFV